MSKTGGKRKRRSQIHLDEEENDENSADVEEIDSEEDMNYEEEWN
jgi:hypothetical protein